MNADDRPAPLVICVAPNGARRTKADHPALPMTPEELAKEAAACAAAGAGVIHLHVRDANGGHSLDPDLYRAAIAAIRQEAGERLAIQVTTEAVGIYSPPEQMAVVRELKPQAASLALRELAPTPAHEPEAGAFFASAIRAGVGLQYILYTPDEAQRLVEMANKGVIPDARPHALFVLGRYTPGQRSTPRDLLPFLAQWPQDWPWSVCAFGPQEALCLSAAIALGGHVRCGFENNLRRPDGGVAADNAELVANIRRVAEQLGRPVATPEQVAEVYGLTR